MPIQVEAWLMFPSRGSYPTRAAFAPPASGGPPRFLTSSLVCSPPTPLLRRPALRVPLAVGLPRCERCFWTGRACVRRRLARRRRLGPGPPPTPHEPWTDRGLPGYWAVLFKRAAVVHPASEDAPSPLD